MFLSCAVVAMSLLSLSAFSQAASDSTLLACQEITLIFSYLDLFKNQRP
jgi:hypothetical protein